MVTGLVEKGKRKCEKYWPTAEDEQIKSGDLIIISTGVAYGEGFVMNNLQVNKRGKRHNLVHYWYNTWPDHGVPVDAEGNMFSDNLIGTALTWLSCSNPDQEC